MEVRKIKRRNMSERYKIKIFSKYSYGENTITNNFLDTKSEETMELFTTLATTNTTSTSTTTERHIYSMNT